MEAFLKGECPHCGQSIEYPAEGTGQTVPCPTCDEAFVLQPKPVEPPPVPKVSAPPPPPLPPPAPVQSQPPAPAQVPVPQMTSPVSSTPTIPASPAPVQSQAPAPVQAPQPKT